VTGGGRLVDLLDPEGVAERLDRAGLPERRAAKLSGQSRACAEALRRLGIPAEAPAHAFFVPGRIEVLGKHTDYAGGRSLLAAATRGFVAVAVPGAGHRVHVLDVPRDETVAFDLDPELEPAAGWANYPMTAARRLARNFPAARAGAAIALTSDLPPAAGMSSSSAFVVATFLTLAAVNRLAEDARYRGAIHTPEDLAGYLAAVENGQDFRTLLGDVGVGTRGGSEDHTAMLCGQPGRLVQYAFAPVRFERAIPVPAGHRFVIAASGVRAEKTGAARERYNRAAELTRVAAALWRAETGRAEPTIGAVLDAAPDAVGRLRTILSTARGTRFGPDALVARLDQFVAEHRDIIPAAGDALERGDLLAFGTLVDRSQSLAERLLGNQIEETVHLARSAREAGAVAASAFGAGFGGSVWALVADAAADSFVERWRADYATRFPAHGGASLFFQTDAGPPALRML
jgi:galactokinase